MQEKNSIVELLKLIRSFCCKHDQNNNKFYAVFNSLCALFINFQKSGQTNNDYLKEFQAQMAMLHDYNTNNIGLVTCLVEETLKKMYNTTVDLVTPEEVKNVKDYVFKRGSATLLLIGAYHRCYGLMKNQMTKQ